MVLLSKYYNLLYFYFSFPPHTEEMLKSSNQSKSDIVAIKK